MDNSTILLSLPRCPFPECAVRGVCVDDELQELSGGGKVCQKTAWKVYAGARKYPGKWQKLLPDRKLSPAAQKLPAAEENVAACCRRECCRLPPKRMFPPAAEEIATACRRKENSLSGRKSVIRAQKTASQKEGCLKSIFFCCERLLPLNSCAWFWRHIVAYAVYCRNLGQNSVCDLH